jgi:hypothetical protein
VHHLPIEDDANVTMRQHLHSRKPLWSAPSRTPAKRAKGTYAPGAAIAANQVALALAGDGVWVLEEECKLTRPRVGCWARQGLLPMWSKCGGGTSCSPAIS